MNNKATSITLIHDYCTRISFKAMTLWATKLHWNYWNHYSMVCKILQNAHKQFIFWLQVPFAVAATLLHWNFQSLTANDNNNNHKSNKKNTKIYFPFLFCVCEIYRISWVKFGAFNWHAYLNCRQSYFCWECQILNNSLSIAMPVSIVHHLMFGVWVPFIIDILSTFQMFE